MTIEPWMATLAVFFALQVGSLIWTLASQRAEGRALREAMTNLVNKVNDIEDDLKGYGRILVDMADFRGDMKLLREQLLAQGKRLDETSARLNNVLDKPN
jgi:uncharacterized coiled-coil protein SlyX